MSTLSETLRDKKETELDRLGSSKGLMAITSGDISTDKVLREAKKSEYLAWETYSDWIDTEENEDAKEFFESVMNDEKQHYDSISTELGDDDVEVSDLHVYLRGCSDTIGRLGASVGRALVSDASLQQTIAFFIGSSDTSSSDLFREMREDTDRHREEADRILEVIVDDGDGLDRAKETGMDVVDIAYEEYVETLEGLGVNPKPTC